MKTFPPKNNRGYVVWGFSKIGVMFSVLIMTLLLYIIYKYISCINAADAGNQVSGNFANALIDVYAAPLGFEVDYTLPEKTQGYQYELSIVNNSKKGVLASMNGSRCQGTCGGAALNIPFLSYPLPVKNYSENETEVIIRNEAKGVSIIRRGACCNCIKVAQLHYDAGGPTVDDADNLNDEYVVFENKCAHSCKITNWTVRDRVISRPPYTFKDVTLSPSSIIYLRSGKGVDTFLNVYWDSQTKPNPAIWNNDGDTVYMRDANNLRCLEYEYVK